MKGVIYEIRCKDDTISDSYIGSTCNFKRRKTQHRISCNNPNNKNYNSRTYIFMRENGGFNNFEFHILEELEYENRIELLKRERYWIEIKKSSLNILLPSRTQKEYGKQWRENNKDYQNEYYENNKDKLNEKMKEWRENNKDKLKEYKKEYNENNKEKINEKQKEKIQCDLCGSIITRVNLSRHKKSIKCQEHKNIILLNYNE